AVSVVKATTHFDDADDLVSRGRHEPSRVRSHVTEALNDDAAAVAIQAQLLDRLLANHEHAASRRFGAPARSADVDRLAGDDSGYGLARMHGIGIHDPGHGLFVG